MPSCLIYFVVVTQLIAYWAFIVDLLAALLADRQMEACCVYHAFLTERTDVAHLLLIQFRFKACFFLLEVLSHSNIGVIRMRHIIRQFFYLRSNWLTLTLNKLFLNQISIRLYLWLFIFPAFRIVAIINIFLILISRIVKALLTSTAYHIFKAIFASLTIDDRVLIDLTSG